MPEKIRQCKEYIEERLGGPINSNALEESCSHMKVLVIKDAEVYHKIAQALGITEMIRKRSIYYETTMPDNENWKIIISSNNSWQFAEKYGDKYKIIRPKHTQGITEFLN